MVRQLLGPQLTHQKSKIQCSIRGEIFIRLQSQENEEGAWGEGRWGKGVGEGR